MSMSEMDQREPGGKEDNIEEVIELSHHGHSLAMSLQLPVDGNSNTMINNEGEHWHGASGNANDNNFSGHEKKQAALMKAVLSRNVEEVKLLLLDGQITDVNSITRDGTALMQLVKSECEVKTCSNTLEIMKLLLQNGARTCSDQSSELSVLFVATRAGRTDMVRLLCEHGVEINEICNNQTAIMIAAELGNLEVVEILLDHGANVNIQNNMKLDALHTALKFDHVECAKLLLSRGAHKNLSMAAKIAVENKQSAAFQFIGSLYKDKDNLLLFAIKNGRDDIVRQLIDMGADVNKVNSVGKKPLEIALESKKEESLIRYLIKNRACVNGSSLISPLHLSMLYSAEITKVLLDSGAEVNAKVGINGDTALMAAIGMELDIETVKLLLAKGAHPNLQNKMGWTALHMAIRRNNIKLVKLLLESGAGLNARDNLHKDTPLIAACHERIDMEIIKFLLAKGARPNTQNNMGWTALHKATLRADVDLVKLLVESGADLEIKTHNNKTAYLLAAGVGDIKVIEALQNLGANIFAVDSNGYNALMTAVQAAIHKKKTSESSILLYLAGNGAQINHQCNNGYTALMMAAEAENVVLLKTLLDLGADVNFTTSVSPAGKKKTSLSIIFKNINFYPEDFTISRLRLINGIIVYTDEKTTLDCIEVLVKHGAMDSLPHRYKGMLHKMIAKDIRSMIQLLLTNGMAPAMVASFKLYKYMPVLRFEDVSPLTVALVRGNIQVAQYLVGNWALCPCDLNGVSLNKLKDNLVTLHKSESVKFVENLLCKPSSLLQLCFIAVSHALGCVPGREERINSLPLPQLVKEKLMFRTEDVQMEMSLIPCFL